MLRWPRNRPEARRFARRLLALVVLAALCAVGLWFSGRGALSQLN